MPRKSEKQKLIDFCCDKYAVDVLMVDSSDDEEQDEIDEQFRMNMMFLLGHRRSVQIASPKPKIRKQNLGNDENVCGDLDPETFYQLMRVRPTEFSFILDLIKEDPAFQNTRNAAQLPVDMQLKIVLFRLGSYGEARSIRKVSSFFYVGDGGTVQIVTRRIFKAILNLKDKFLDWPSEKERSKLVAATRNEMPGCIGYIDTTEVKLADAPGMNPELFLSRKQHYAVKLQAVCDYKLRIRQVTVGHPGSATDTDIFLSCPLDSYPERFFSKSQWLAGDLAYPLRSFLLTPYRQGSTEIANEDREIYNKYFSKHRVRIENCFAVLKEKFGSLNEIKLRMHSEQNKKECNDWIMVCCILHNILIEFNSEDNEIDYSKTRYNIPLQSNTRNSLLNFIKKQSKV